MFGRHGRTFSRMTKKMTVEDILKGPSEEEIAKLQKYRLDAVDEKLTRKPVGSRARYVPVEEIVRNMQENPRPAGSVSSLFSFLKSDTEFGLPHTYNFAVHLDQLARSLLLQQLPLQNRSLEGFKQTLLSSPLVRREYWIDPESKHDVLPLFEQVCHWNQAWGLTNIVNFHLQICLMALWDVEFCADNLRGFRTIPLFLNLARNVRPRADDESADGLKRRHHWNADVQDGPFAHLIDLHWCILRYLKDGYWPAKFPTHAEMAEDLNLSSDLAQMRQGKPKLTIDTFYSLWPDNLTNIASEPVSPSLNLLAAAHAWDLINPSDQPTFPVDEFYMRAWHRHRHELRASQSQAKLPATDWPGYLNRGLDYPAP